MGPVKPPGGNLRRVPLSRIPREPGAPQRRAPLAARETRTRRAPRNTGPSRKVRELVLARDGHACVCCGRSVIGQPYSLQHRKPRGMGGTSNPAVNSPANLVTLCGLATTPGSCHLAAEQRAPEMHARGYWLRSGESAELSPVMVFSPHGPGVMVWLAPGGTYSTEAPVGEVA